VTLLEELNLPCTGIGHRVVHGGEHFSGACPVNDDSLEALKEHIHLAPLHNPVNLLGIEAAQAAFPGLEQVMVFDTSFHQTMPKRAYLYALPYELYKEHGVRKYGFHGTSHRYVSEQAALRLNIPLENTALITAHLGNGCSATAVLGGKSVDTTMGLTPLEGLVMGTRIGDVDPSLHQYLGSRLNMTQQEISDLLNKQSGLLGLSGQTNDMRELLRLEATGDAQAHVAVEVFCYRLAKAIVSLMVGLGRLDALVFTGGIGENSKPVRARTIELLGFLGLSLDPDLNEINGVDQNGRITSSTSPCALVIPTDEELVIARDTARVI
jgi:acetate kinase